MDVKTSRSARYLSTPGEILKEEFLEPLGISNYRLAQSIGVSQSAIGQIVNGQRAISIPMAYRLAKAFNMTPEFWLDLQRDYDLLRFNADSLGPITPLISS